MLREIIKFRSQKGSLMVEAMAMLALISMVTPVVYKKAAERTSELQDINAASQMRSIITSIDKYMKDNYVTMKKGETVKTECTGTDKDMNYSAFKAAGDKNITVDLNHFCEYLPYGLDTKSKTFKDFSVAIKKEDTSSGRVMLTAVVVAKPTDEKMQMMRASRIASMIGSNGGVVRDDTKPNQATANVQGTQGIWNLDLKDFGLAEQPSGTVVAASMQSVATSSVGSEDVLYRVDTGYDEMNTMSTDLFMADHNIENVNNMIINGKNPNGDGNSLVVKNGKTSLAGDLAALANATVGKALTVTGATTLGSTLGVTGAATLKSTLDVTGDTNLKSNATVGGNLSVTGTTTLTGKLTANGGADIKGGATVTGGLTADTADITGKLTAAGGNFTMEGNQATIKGNLTLTGDGKTTGIITAPKLSVDILEGDTGKFESLWAGTNNKTNSGVDTYTLAVNQGFVRIKDTNFAVGGVTVNSDGTTMTNGTISAPGYARLAVNNADTFMSNTNVAMLANAAATIRAGTSALVATPDFRIKDRTSTADGEEYFRVKSAATASESKGVQVSNTDFIVSDKANNLTSKVFEVNPTATLPSQKASIRVRKGVMEIAANTDTTKTDANATGYIQLDRIVGNRDWDGDNLPTSGGGTVYDRFQVNPAYTSVMHDIKLTTRGGARLSDILPDFINKGIYVLDNTYKEAGCGGQVCNWEGPVNVFNGTPGFSDAHIAAADCASGDMSCVASPWLGYIPAPQCPPGYSKVATLAPIRFNMAQAGLVSKPSNLSSRAGKYDIWSPKNPAEQYYGSASSVDNIQNLTFQKSTWLNTSLKAHCLGTTNYQCSNNENAPEGKGFQGWSGIMGFIYGGRVYEDLFREIYGSSPASDAFAWNLFPVYNQELTAIADVYCYFDRGKFTGTANAALIDTEYDQIGNFRGPTADGTGNLYAKPSAYKNRLNDPKLKYADPW